MVSLAEHHKCKCVSLLMVFWPLLWILNECSMLFKSWTAGFYTVLVSHSPIAQWGSHVNVVYWEDVLTWVLSFSALVQLFLLPAITSLTAFPETCRPFISDACFVHTVSIGPSWGTFRFPLFIHFFSPFIHVFKCFEFNTMQRGKHSKMVKMIIIPSLLPSNITIYCEIRQGWNRPWKRQCILLVRPPRICKPRLNSGISSAVSIYSILSELSILLNFTYMSSYLILQ